MELRQVEYAIAVVDHGGFTRAASALHVSQPSLSQGIRALEVDVGVELFHRLGRRVSLTAAGEAFIGPARQLLRDVRTARAAVTAVAGLATGRLDLVALPTLAVDPLAVLIGAFRTMHPGLAVRLVEPETADAVVDLVREGRCEVGLAEMPVSEDVASHHLLTQELLAVCPPGTRLRRRGRLPVERLAEMPLVATPPGTSTRRLVDQVLAGSGVTPMVAVETGQREAIVPLVLAGAGTTFLPAPLARAVADQGAVVASLQPRLQRRIALVHRHANLSPAAGAFVTFALAHLQANSTGNRQV